MGSRPRIIIHPSQLDKRLEVAALILLILLWLLFLFSFFTSPSIIPIHYNALGKVDNYGSKTTLFILPIIATAVYFALTQLNKYPHMFNYMTTLTKENAEQQYRAATRMLRFVKLFVLIIFTLLVLLGYLVVKGYTNGLGVWFLPFTIVILFVPIVVGIVQSKQRK